MGNMKNNVQLVGVSAYTDEYEDWFLKLIYEYDDDKGKHELIYPKVELPFAMCGIPYIVNNSAGDFIGMPNYYTFGEDAYCHVREGVVKDPLTGKEIGTTIMADILIKPKIHEMTLEEVEKKLGYKVKIVSNKDTK